VAVAVLLDEHIRLATAYRLVALGLDVVPLRDRGLLEFEDWALLAWCVENERVICTRNRLDFQVEHRRRRGRGESHPGILIVERHWNQDQIYWALRQFLEADPDPTLLINQVVDLPPATAEFIEVRTEEAPP
jgi:hypothetical protein